MMSSFNTAAPDTRHWTLRGATIALAAVTWASTILFATYIIAFFGGSLVAGAQDEAWTKVLPDLYSAETPVRNAAIAAHFVTGAILLFLGPIQLIYSLRRRMPWLHRATGRLYGVSALIAGVAGLLFILRGGTVGGAWMSTGFALYGGLIALCAVMAMVTARRGDFAAHRGWAIRLFALAIASWLYRMEYGLYLGAFEGPGHTDNFDGWFDKVMDFAFYLPNLLIAELFIRIPPRVWPVRAQYALAVVSLASAGLIGLATFLFAKLLWFPAIAFFGPKLFGA